MTRKARPVAADRWRSLTTRLARSLGIRRQVILLESEEIPVPVTWGAWRPRILLPAHAMTWEDDRLRAVLLHELSHIKRSDWLLRVLARLAAAAHWFNPLAWEALRRLAVEQELACDQEVLQWGGTPIAYASQLLEVARDANRRLALSALGLARPGSMEERIVKILDSTHRRWSGLSVSLPVILTIVVVIPALAAVQPWSAPATAQLTSADGQLGENFQQKSLDLESAAELDRQRIEAILRDDQEVLSGKRFAYDPGGRKDPFVRYVPPSGFSAANCPAGIGGLLVEGLELLGVFQLSDGTRLAAVLATDNRSYLLSTGTQLCDGEVTSVLPQKLVLWQPPGRVHSERPLLGREVVLSIAD